LGVDRFELKDRFLKYSTAKRIRVAASLRKKSKLGCESGLNQEEKVGGPLGEDFRHRIATAKLRRLDERSFWIKAGGLGLAAKPSAAKCLVLF
jgi:hypothetical protein